MPNVWSLLTLEKRQYAGNIGYDDADDRYAYDSFVANHKRISPGDLAILRDRQGAFAIARVEDIQQSDGTKIQFRCPVCTTTAIKRRQNVSPAFRCSSGHEFEVPREDVVDCRLFVALFGSSRQSLAARVRPEQIRALSPRPSDQLAIQELSRERIAASGLAELNQVLEAISAITTNSGDIAVAEEGSTQYTPNLTDTRTAALRSIKQRRGQQAFRVALCKRYHGACVISGCVLLPLLEAAHISPYRGIDDNHPSNGLLLRADIHTLFDLDLVGVEPRTLTIHVHPFVAQHAGYSEFRGTQLKCGSSSPSNAALVSRWARFRERNSASNES